MERKRLIIVENNNDDFFFFLIVIWIWTLIPWSFLVSLSLGILFHRKLASGSGDKTVRFWDIHTQTPEFTCTGHTAPVLALSWSPDGQKLVSADENGAVSCFFSLIIYWNIYYILWHYYIP